MSVLVQSFFRDQLMGCRANGMQLPEGIDPQRGLPPELIVWADTRSEFVGDTLERAYKTGGNYFRKTPLIIFVILPERGENATRLWPPHTIVRDDYIASSSVLGSVKPAQLLALAWDGKAPTGRCMSQKPTVCLHSWWRWPG